MHAADRLVAAVRSTQSIACVGLDPRPELIPPVLVAEAKRRSDHADQPIGDERVSEAVARLVAGWGRSRIGSSGFSDVGAVVGATWPDDARMLRQLMPCAMFLVPGFDAQGATALDAVAGATEQGDGTLVSSSRAVIGAWRASW